MASKGTRDTEEQIILILKEVESGTKVAAICRQYGVSEQTVYRWLFADGQEAQTAIEQWRQEYNHHRPHSSLGYLTPAAFAEQSRLSLHLD